MYRFIWGLIKYAYSHGGRNIVIEKIDDPNSDWDDWALEALDRVFDYRP